MMLIEIVFLVLIIGIIYSVAITKPSTKLHYGVDKMMLYFKYLRYVAMVDDAREAKNDNWFKARWSIKFRTCNENKDGHEKHFSIFKNDHFDTGINTISRSETLKDPINNKHLYSSGCDKLTKKDSQYVLLTSQFGIKDIKSNCNSEGAIQIVFAKDGRVFERIGDKENSDEILEKCKITFTDKNNKQAILILEPKTGYIYKQK